MIKDIFLVLILFLSLGESLAYNIDIVPSSQESIPEDLVMDFSYRESREQPETKMPLFTQTCDNIAYSGVIEQQVISLLTDVKDFVTAVTDPVVTVNKFDAGIFLYAFGKCFSKSTQEAFGKCKKQRTGETCLKETLTEVIGSTDELATVEVGLEGSMGSVGFATKIETSMSKLLEAGSNIIPTMIDNGWFDITFKCIDKERQSILEDLDAIFNRNYKIKTSIINSINKKCEVSIYQDGDPGTWADIYNLNKELVGGETSETMLKIEEYVSDNIIEVDIGSAKIQAQIDATHCFNGVGSGNCGSVADLKNIDRLSDYQIDSSNNESYQILKAKEITKHFYGSDGSVLDEYSNKVGKTINPIMGVLGSLIPLENVDLDKSIFDEIPVEKFLVEFYNLKDMLGIYPDTDLSNAIDDIFYMISSPKYTVTLKNRSGEKFILTDGMELDYLTLDKISEPRIDPFDKGFIRYTSSGAANNSNVIAKTINGKYIVLNTGFDDVRQESVLGFYQSLASTLIFANSKDLESKYINKAIYDKEKLVDDQNYIIIKDTLEKAIDVHSQFNYKSIFNDGYEISKRSGDWKASLEYHMVKFLLMKRILILLYTIEGDPDIETDNVDVHTVVRTHELPRDLFYGLISSEKDYSITRRQKEDNIYGKVSRFYKILASRYTINNMVDIIKIASDQVEAYPDFTQLEVRVNTLLNFVRTTNQINSIKSLELIENIE